MKFKKLKLNGFKSFVEPIDLEIQDGLTGIVGPNGCGKSNVVEAIKWVMGESSAKQMRGDDMDDVIFGGSSNQSPVSGTPILLSNSVNQPVNSTTSNIIQQQINGQLQQHSTYVDQRGRSQQLS